MYGKIKEHLEAEIQQIKEDGLFKEERIIVSPQDTYIKIATGQEVLTFVRTIIWGYRLIRR